LIGRGFAGDECRCSREWHLGPARFVTGAFVKIGFFRTKWRRHSTCSRPCNPDVANAFFRAGMIEAWGRGIERIVEACRAANAPEPIMRCEPSGLWVEFDFPKILNEEGDRLKLGEKLGAPTSHGGSIKRHFSAGLPT